MREELIERRRASVPRVRYPDDLPITARRQELLDAIRDHQVVIVAGETGSGKSTQLPKLCLEAGRGVTGMIGHTQPRRIAARTVAERIAEELGSEIGGAVGYAVRFTDRVGDLTLVKVMTDGILLAELQRDRMLRRYDTIIVDEAHERSLNIDFILGYLKQLLPKRPDLKVIVTSATIDTARFSEHFDGAPVVEVSGRTYPVEIRYQPYGEEPDDERDQTQAICDAVEELFADVDGDVLVFLSGEREIRDAAEALRRLDLKHTEVLPLYARLTAAEQHKVFRPHTGRRVVLATNVAETSLTVPGIRSVVDPGTARISRFNRRTKVQRLPIEDISQASANQRAGRCGRVAPGVCIRLYSEDDLVQRPEFTEPEILRTNLASVILQMTAIGLGDVERFPFVEPPDARSIKDGVDLLEELGALRPDSRKLALTETGRRLAQLPVDPRLGRMILEADRNGVVGDVIVIAAALSIQDVRERPQGEERARADELHRRFVDETSDFLSYLKLWSYVQEQQQALSSNQLRRLCKSEFLHHLRIREWQDLTGQLRQVAKSIGIRPHRHDPDQLDADGIHRSLLAGLLSHVGMRDSERNEFLGARQARFAIQPGSVLHRKPPRWVMVAELVETNRLWGRTAARIQPEWAEQLGAHLVKRSHGEPWWDAGRGAAMANERVTLYGIPVVASRRVQYARVDPRVARDMFVWHALVEGEWETHHDFVAANRALLDELKSLEDRVRRRDILVGPEEVFAFYDARVPDDVVSVRHFDRWWKEERGRRPDLLTLTVDDLVDPAAGEVGADAYPEVWEHGDGLSLPLSYEFDPGAELDGVTLDVPLPLLARVSPDGFDWQVPGLREELVTALVRSLPKELRRAFVPVPEHVAAFLASASPGDGPLLDVLARYLSQRSGVAVRPRHFDLSRVPDHLRMTFRVVTERGRPLAWSKDLVALRDHLQAKLQATISDAARAMERTDIRRWDLGTLERTVTFDRGGHRITAYPALVDEGADGVALRTLPTPGEQRRAHWLGVRRLLLLNLPAPTRAARRILADEAGFALAHAPEELADDVVRAAVDELMAASGGPVWDEAGFAALRDAVKAGLPKAVAAVAADTGRILGAVGDVEARLDHLGAGLALDTLTDIRVQLARLVHPGFVSTTGAARLPDVLRYVRGIEHRLQKLPASYGKDRQLMLRIQELEAEHERLGSPLELFWMLQELRVATFAQVLGARGSVSEQKVRRELARLGA